MRRANGLPRRRVHVRHDVQARDLYARGTFMEKEIRVMIERQQTVYIFRVEMFLTYSILR